MAVVREGSPRGSEILSAHLPVVPRACKGLAAIAATNTRQASVGPAGGTRVNAVNSIKSGFTLAHIVSHGCAKHAPWIVEPNPPHASVFIAQQRTMTAPFSQHADPKNSVWAQDA